MALFSADLAIIQDSVVKISDKLSRDYVELESLQNSQKGSLQFTNMTIDFIKKRLYEYLKSKKPSYDVVFYGENIDDDELKSNFRYLINPICGKINLMHAIPYFAVSIALLKKEKDVGFKTICGVIDNPITQESFTVEEGKGAYVNARRIRVSSRSNLDESIVAIGNVENKDFMSGSIKTYKNLIITNCEALNICNVASGKYEATVLNGTNIFHELPLLLVKEAGGFVKTLENGLTVASNGLLKY